MPAVPGLGRQVAERAAPGAADGLLELRPRGRRWRRPAPCPASGRPGAAPCRRPRRSSPTTVRRGRGRRPGRRPARRGPGSPAPRAGRPAGGRRRPRGRAWPRRAPGGGPRAAAPARAARARGPRRRAPGPGPRGGRGLERLQQRDEPGLGRASPRGQRQVLAEPGGEQPPRVGGDRLPLHQPAQALGPGHPGRGVPQGDQAARVPADRPGPDPARRRDDGRIQQGRDQEPLLGPAQAEGLDPAVPAEQREGGPADEAMIGGRQVVPRRRARASARSARFRPSKTARSTPSAIATVASASRSGEATGGASWCGPSSRRPRGGGGRVEPAGSRRPPARPFAPGGAGRRCRARAARRAWGEVRDAWGDASSAIFPGSATETPGSRASGSVSPIRSVGRNPESAVRPGRPIDRRSAALRRPSRPGRGGGRAGGSGRR